MLGRRFKSIRVHRQPAAGRRNHVPRHRSNEPGLRSGITRRRFVQAAAAAAPLAFMFSLPKRVLGANERLNVACVGVTGRGGDDMDGVSGENVVAICDVDARNLAVAAKKEPIAKAKQFKDFRKMLDAMASEIDAVVVGTPDHIHAPAGLAAMARHKHLYSEKPLAHNVREIRLMREAAARNKLATQMGTQIHAGDNYRRVVELVRAGAIGKVARVHNWVPTSYSGSQTNVKRPEGTPPVPEGLDWDLWLGPAKDRPYNPAYHPFWWRGWWDFANGALGDMACHHMDLPYWALGLRDPVTIESEAPPFDPEVCPKWQIVHYHYPARGNQPPVHLTWYHGGKRPPEFDDAALNLPKQWSAGTLFVGEDGKMLLADYDKYRLYPEPDFKDYKKPEKSIPRSIGHHAEWIKACKDGSPTTCNFDYSGALAEAVLLGCVAHKAGKKIEWDAKAMKCTNAPDAQKFLTREYRKGWELEHVA
jgi:predicted dehydrogenase